MMGRTQVGIQFLGIQPDITTLLNNLAAKKPDFDQAGLKILDVRSLIRDSVSIQQEGAKTLGTSVSHTPSSKVQRSSKNYEQRTC